MLFEITIKNVQHISELQFSIDLSKNKLHCIVGKNGIGKTTLIKAINNLQSTDTFQKTASPYIFTEQSEIIYNFDSNTYSFNFNEKLKLIDTKQIIHKDIKDSIFVELTMPHGRRFSHFQKLGSVDEELRNSISIESYTEPTELIEFLNAIYDTERFINLKEFKSKGEKYYFILKEGDYYIREDYFSSGEYFVVSLYKMIQSKKKCITIDEIDISLDAHAQVNLIKQLRNICQQYNVNIVFTTHSLPLMKTLEDDELYYMSENDKVISIEPKSYNYVKSLMFGFHNGWDKYILTEDIVLQKYLEHIISKNDSNIFYKYKIIYIGGGSQVVDLMLRNCNEHFLTDPINVLCVLDGDQKEKGHVTNFDNVICIPFESIEKDLFKYYEQKDPGIPRLGENIQWKKNDPGKTLFRELTKTRNNLMSKSNVFTFLENKNQGESNIFQSYIMNFLTTSDNR